MQNISNPEPEEDLRETLARIIASFDTDEHRAAQEAMLDRMRQERTRTPVQPVYSTGTPEQEAEWTRVGMVNLAAYRARLAAKGLI